MTICSDTWKFVEIIGHLTWTAVVSLFMIYGILLFIFCLILVTTWVLDQVLPTKDGGHFPPTHSKRGTK